MDENFRLYEWLAYHYHVLPLRYVVVAVDPRSQLSPEPIFDLFRTELNMTILTWTDKDFIVWEDEPSDKNLSLSFLTSRHDRRQRLFLEKCMQHLYQQGRNWTAMWDVDEYVIFNRYNRGIGNVTSPNDLAEPGSILKYVKAEGESHCFPMRRLEVGTKENPSLLRNSSLQQLDIRRLNTVRYRYRNRPGTGVGNGNGKVFLNVQKVNFRKKVRTPHRPAPSICPGAFGRVVTDAPFMMLHYVGSWPAYSFRSNDPRFISKTHQSWLKRSALSFRLQPKTETWLEGFINNVGAQRAWKVLRHAGLPDGYNSSISEYEAVIAAETLKYESQAFLN
jgi:hypothetical protein